jgi:hypothetical protein
VTYKTPLAHPILFNCQAVVAEEVFEGGRITMSRGDMMLGLELMLEGINMYEQTHQVVHPEVAFAYNQYAITIHQIIRMRMSQMVAEDKEADPAAGLDVATAIKLQRQAVMTGERTLGLHHPETIGFYFNLAMLENVAGDQTVTLRLFRHILHLWDVVYGRDHPELPSILVSHAGGHHGHHSLCVTSLNLFINVDPHRYHSSNSEPSRRLDCPSRRGLPHFIGHVRIHPPVGRYRSEPVDPGSLPQRRHQKGCRMRQAR